MVNVQTRLLRDIRHRFLRRVRRSLVHYDYQVPSPVVPHHLPKESDHFIRVDAFLVQLEDQPTHAIDGRECRNTSALASHLLPGRVPTRSPGLSQKSSQRHVRLILKIQQRPVFLHGSAYLRGFRPHPFVTRFLVHFKILSLRLLISQPGFSQASPNSVVRNRCRKFLLNNPMQSTDCPQIGFKSKSRSSLKNDLNKPICVKVFKQTRSAASHLSPKPVRAFIIESGYPSIKCGAINTISVGNFTDGQTTANSLDGPNPNFKGRVPSLVMLFHNQQLNTKQATCVNTCCKFIATGHINGSSISRPTAPNGCSPTCCGTASWPIIRDAIACG